MSKRVLITGSGGFVGKNLYDLIKEDFDVFGVGLHTKKCVDRVVDISSKLGLLEILNNFQPDVIVHLAALSNVEKCETEREMTDLQNIEPIANLCEWAGANDKKIIYLSTDYVYDGSKGNFSEEDLENPLQYYGKTKLIGEKMVASLKNYIILRSTVIYGWDFDGMNFFMQLYRNHVHSLPMKVAVDQISNPTYVGDLCELIKKILVSELNGVYVATGNTSYSRYEFAVLICKYFGWNVDFLIPMETASLGQVAKRPLNNSTNNSRVTKDFSFQFHGLDVNFEKIKMKMEIQYANS